MVQSNLEADSSTLPSDNSVVRNDMFDDNIPTPEVAIDEVRDTRSNTSSFVVQVPLEAEDVNSNNDANTVVVHIRDGLDIPFFGGGFETMHARVRDAYHSLVGPASVFVNDDDDPDNASNHRLAWHFLTQPPLIITLLLMFVVSVFLIIAKEMSLHTTLVISTIVSLIHYYESLQFSRVVHRMANVKLYTIFLGILLRNCLNYVFWQSFEVYQMAILIPNFGGEDSFFITMARIIQVEIFVMDLALFIKVLVYCFKWIDEGLQKRIYIWIDHTCYIYRMLIPTSQWAMYFGSSFLLVAYLMFKVYSLITRITVWIKFTQAVLSNVNLGEAVPKEQLEPDLNCSICQSVFKQPRKLQCTHIFCASCIRTWIDTGKGDTCPLCRSEVCDSHVSKVKDYESFFPVNVF